MDLSNYRMILQPTVLYDTMLPDERVRGQLPEKRTDSWYLMMFHGKLY